MEAQDRRDDTPVLVVDLDGTLIRTDMLYECFWQGLSESWQVVPEAFKGLKTGRAALKQRLSKITALDVTLLPYNDAVLDYIRARRAEQGRVVLVTAADQSLADRVAAHLDLFDEVHGSDGKTNLKGSDKASFLTERFGPGGYDYIGDSHADLPVWTKARKAIAVDPSPSLQILMRDQDARIEHLAGGPDQSAYMKALRPHQWLKNILVFLPIIASQTFSLHAILATMLAFAAFSLVSSAGYMLNDLMDLRADRAHPRKSARPLASGNLPIAHGTAMVPGLLIVGLTLAALANWQTCGVIALYFGMTTAYSIKLKRLAIADIGTLAALYTLRIIAGGLATGIEPSVWLLAFSIFLFFSLAAVKRQAELVDLDGRGISSVRRRGYTVDDLPMVSQMAITSGYVSVMVLALYLNSPAVTELYTTPWILWGICLVMLYWISRVVLVTHRGLMHDDPIVFGMRDRTSRLCLLLIALLTLGAAVL